VPDGHRTIVFPWSLILREKAGYLFTYLPLFMAFPRAAFLPMALLLVSVLALQRVCDAYVYPAEGSASEMVMNTAISMGFVVVLEKALTLYAPRLALSIGEAILAALATILMSQWRMIFRREDHLDPERRKLQERLIATWHAYALFALVYLPLGLTNISAVPGGHTRDKFLGWAPFACLMAAQRIRNINWRSIFDRVWPSVTRDTTIDELKLRRDQLPVRNRTSRFPSDLILEFLYFVIISLPLLIGGWEWVSGDPAAADVDWLQAGINSGVVLVLIILWIHIKRMALELAEAFQEEINRRESDARNNAVAV
jgi:hypothetical protein